MVKMTHSGTAIPRRAPAPEAAHRVRREPAAWARSRRVIMPSAWLRSSATTMCLRWMVEGVAGWARVE